MDLKLREEKMRLSQPKQCSSESSSHKEAQRQLSAVWAVVSQYNQSE